MKKLIDYIVFGVLLFYLLPTIGVALLVVMVQRFIFKYTKQDKAPELPYVFKTQANYRYEWNLESLADVHFDHPDGWFKIQWDADKKVSVITLETSKHPNGFYPWDGCSPKLEIFDLIIGTPDGKTLPDGHPVTFRASLIHDVIYENRQALEKYISRKETDQLFYRILKEDGFKLAWPYYASVRLFGWSYWYSY